MDPKVLALLIFPSIVQCFFCDFRGTENTDWKLVDVNEAFGPNSSFRCRSWYCHNYCRWESVLRIQSSNISTLPPSAFTEYSEIVKLDLRSIHLRFISLEAFQSLKELRELYLADNVMTEVSKGVFNTLHQLEILDLSNNKIRTIEDSSFTGLDYLKEVLLSRNQLNKIEGNLFQGVKKLDVLDLSQNLINKFKFSVDDLTIKTLNLSSNNMKVVDFYKFPKCETIDFSQNKISFLDNLDNITISYLDLSNQHLRRVNGTLDYVKTLTISHNELETVNLNFNRPEYLLEINLTFNQILSLEKNIFQGQHSLQSLDLSHNNLTLIERLLFHDLENLISLNVSHNQIEHFLLGTFNNLNKLTTLNISHNRLLELDDHTLTPLSDLTYLYFESNQIRSFDAAHFTEHFLKLKTISLPDNYLWKCPELISTVRHLQKRGITVLRGNRFDVENLYGVACDNQIVPERVDTLDKSTNNVFKQANTGPFDFSFVRFFNSTEEQTQFFRYLNNFLRNGISKEDDATREKSIPIQTSVNNGLFIAILLVLIFISFLFLLVIYLSFFKKFKRNLSHGNLIQDTLL